MSHLLLQKPIPIPEKKGGGKREEGRGKRSALAILVVVLLRRGREKMGMASGGSAAGSC